MAATALNFSQIDGLDLTTVRKEISFPIEIEKVQSATSGQVLSKSIVFNTAGGPNSNERIPIGFISDRRKIVPYGDMMDLVVNQLQPIVPFKLIESKVSSKSMSVSQRYVLDCSVTNPDGEELSTMLIANYSYLCLPLFFELGTYRYVCSNGAVVGFKEFEKMSVRMHDLNSLYVDSIGNGIRRGLDEMKKISDSYARLASESWIKYLVSMFNDVAVPVAFKKDIADYLISNRYMCSIRNKTIKNDTFLSLKCGSSNADLVSGDDTVYLLLDTNRSAWHFYNDCTDISTHMSPSVSLRRRNDLSISSVFGV